MVTAARHPQHTRAVLMLLIANLYWGLSFPVIKAVVLLHEKILPPGSEWFSTVYTVAPRFLLAFVILLLWQIRELGQITRPEWKQGVTIGLFAACGMLLQNDGLRFTAASTSAFLTQFYAILIPVYVAWRARRRPAPIVWWCCALVLVGVAVLGRFNWRELSFGRGEAETLLSSFFFMGQILTLEKPEFAANRAMKITLVMAGTEMMVFWILAAFTAPNAAAIVTPWTSPGWLGLTGMLTVFCTLGAFSLMNTWQPKISATEAGLIYCVEPIFGSLMALFLPALFSAWVGINYPNEVLTAHLLIGGGLITLANVLIQLRPLSRPR